MRLQTNRKSTIEDRKCLLRLGTRTSPLALIQSRSISRLLQQANPGLSVELVEITTTGDKVRNKPLHEFGGRGVFVKELENALLGRRIDLAVHSLKDLPTRQPRGLAIGAIVGREDTRDVAAIRGCRRLEGLPAGSVIGTGSPRRRAQLKAYYPHLEFAEIRGNVETRLRKVQEGQYAGTILARAGLKRLGLLSGARHLGAAVKGVTSHPTPELTVQVLPHSLMLPAPGQGALAIECRAADKRVRRFLQTVHNAGVSACVSAERAALQALGGGCRLPLGALATVVAPRPGLLRKPEDCARLLHLRAVLGLPDGTELLRTEGSMPLAKARELGRKVARAFLTLGGKELLAKLTEPQMTAETKVKSKK